MQVNISARHGNLSTATQDKITEKVEKLNRFFDRLTAIQVTIDLKDRESPDVEVRASAEHTKDFIASTGGELFAALDSVVHKLEQQLRKHKEKLQALLAGDVESLIGLQKRGEIVDLKLAEYLVAPTLGENATFQDVLGVAMHREKSSHEFYSTMATLADDAQAKALFEFLAQEELVHKNKVESLYDEVVYQDN